jgi:hypothetical protein
MSGMTTDLDDVRELTLDEVEAVSGGDACEAAAVTGGIGIAGTSAGIGFMIGGPVGAAIGFGVGLVVGGGTAYLADEHICDD